MGVQNCKLAVIKSSDWKVKGIRVFVNIEIWQKNNVKKFQTVSRQIMIFHIKNIMFKIALLVESIFWGSISFLYNSAMETRCPLSVLVNQHTTCSVKCGIQ